MNQFNTNSIQPPNNNPSILLKLKNNKLFQSTNSFQMSILEMPYIMNVLLYIENDMILSIPQISKKCRNACNAMKINPWKNSTTPLQDIKNIRKVFPRIQTLRINKSTIKQHYEQINILCFDNIEIVKDTPLQRFKLPPLIRNKAHIAFKEKDINNTVYTVYLDYCLIATIGKIRRYPNIRHLFLILSSPPILDEVNELNKCSNSIHITIKLSNSDLELFVHRENLSKKIHVVTNIFNSLYVIPQEESIDFCLNTLRSIDNMILFEKFFLPTKLIRKNDGNVLTDLTYFEYVKEIKLIPTGNAPKNYIKLPTSTEDIKVDEFNKEIDHTEIINWKDLNNIQRIQDFHQLYVPYPQIKKK